MPPNLFSWKQKTTNFKKSIVKKKKILLKNCVSTTSRPNHSTVPRERKIIAIIIRRETGIMPGGAVI